MRISLFVVFLLAVYGGHEAFCQPTALSTATPCNKLELAYAMVRRCSDGNNITDECCSVVFSALGRGSMCFCQIKREPFFRFSRLPIPHVMESVLAGCFASPAMYGTLGSDCPSRAHPIPDAPAVSAPIPHPAPDTPAIPAPISAPSPSEAMPSSPTPLSFPSGVPVLSDHPAQPCEPKETKCSRYKAAAIVGWSFTGLLLLILIVVAWAGGISYGSQRKLARWGDFEMMPVGRHAANFARICDTIQNVDENDQLHLNANGSSSCPLSQGGPMSNLELISQDGSLSNVQEVNVQAGGDENFKASRADANTGRNRRPKVIKASSLDAVDGGRGMRLKKPSKWVSGSIYAN